MIRQDIKKGSLMHGFRNDRIQDIPELRTQAAVFTHEKTDARLLHLFNEDPNNLFCACFRTPVYNNTGVPHILEHCVLAGSKKFPVKDPFKEMLKGSLQTFLNAITYPDRTMYPVSSQLKKDFYNLVNVYCDAVFHPLLTEVSFAQEGWHFDLPAPDGAVSIKGIVYNEMKGVFSDFRSHVARKTMGALFPDTTYNYESGGEPEHITSLSYRQFCEFHKKYYHPSNAFIILYGNIPTQETAAFLQENYFRFFRSRKVNSQITPQKIWDAPRRVSLLAPSSKEDDGTASVILSWLFGSSTDPDTALLGRIFSHYLFDNEGSPLRRALIDSKLGEDLDDMCGFDSDLVQGMFCAGLRKTKPQHADTIRALIVTTIENEIKKKLDPELLEGAIRQIEFRLREITDGGSSPYNLALANRALRSWIYGGDPLAHLCFEKPLEKIKKKKIAGTQFFARKMQELFVKNSHNLLSVIEASSALGEQLGRKTEAQAAALSKTFTKDDRRKYFDLAQKIVSEQRTPIAPEALATLPKLSRADLAREGELVPTEVATVAGVTAYTHPLFTAGIVYLDLIFDLGSVPFDLLAYFPIYAELITRCGAAGYTPEQMAKRVSLSTGGVNSSDMCVTKFGTSDDLVFKFFVHGKALPERFGEMLGIITDILQKPLLDNNKLIGDILFEIRNDLNAAVIRSGHSFAASIAGAGLSKSRYLEEMLGGVSLLRFLDSLVKKNDLHSVANAMKSLHKAIINRNQCIISTTVDRPPEYLKAIGSFIKQIPASAKAEARPDFTLPRQSAPRGLEISSSVNYVVQCWRMNNLTPEAFGEHYLLSRILSTGYLWDKIRVEGGAYGGMSMVSSGDPVFSCASYRDPNLTRTLVHFKDGLAKAASGLSDDEVDQSVIGAIGRIDQPRSPHGKGIGETVSLLCDRTPEKRQHQREAILNCTPRILAQRAAQLLEEKQTAIVVLGSRDAFDIAAKEGLVLQREPLLKNGE